MAGDGVLIVEDHRLLAEVLATALAARGVPATVVDPDQLDAIVGSVARGTLVLLDLRLGRGRDGGRAVRPLCARGAQVVVVTGTHDPVPLARALEDGALAVLDKRQPFDDLLGAIVAIRAGDTPPDDAGRRRLLLAAAARRAERESAALVLGRLSDREAEVLDELSAGHNAHDIAATAGVALTTVRSQIRSVLMKLGVTSQLQAVALAHDLRRRSEDPTSRPDPGPARPEP